MDHLISSRLAAADFESHKNSVSSNRFPDVPGVMPVREVLHYNAISCNHDG
jgi:hypothetical protein